MFKFRFKSTSGFRDILGIDLGGQILKIVYLKDYQSYQEIVDFSTYSIEGLGEEEVVKIVKNYLNGFKLKNPQIISILNPQSVITKNIEVPSVDPREIREIINLQASRHTPYSREEIIVDYIDIGTYKKNYTKILLIIVAKNLIKKQFSLLEKAGFSLERVAFSSEGICRYGEKIFKMETIISPYGIIHLDDKTTEFIISLKNKVCFVRAIPIGATHLLYEREKYQLRFLEEIKNSLEAYQNENIDATPQIFFLTGVFEESKNLSNLLYNTLHLPIREASYLRDLKLSEEVLKKIPSYKLISFLNILAIIFSLENLKVSFIPEEIKLKRSLEERGRELIKAGIYILTILVITFFILISKIWFKTLYIKALDAKFGEFEKEARVLERDYLRVSLIKKYLSNRGLPLEVLLELYNLISEDMGLSNIRFDDGERLTITGFSETMSGVFSFVEKIENSKYFKEVKTKYTTKRREGPKDITDFEISALIEKD